MNSAHQSGPVLKNADPAGQQVINFDDIFGRYIASIQKVWAHDRGESLGSSENFDCLRLNWFNKLGAQNGFAPPEQVAPQSWGAMERGNVIENAFVVPGLRVGLPAGMHLELAGTQQQTLVVGRNSATPDGLITGLVRGPLTVIGGDQEIHIPDIQSDCVVLEIKSIDPRAILLEERAKHHGQTQIQIGLIRDTTPHKPVYSIILYIDASFLDKFTPFVVAFDPAIYAEAKHRAESIWDITEPWGIVPEGRFSDRCKTCPWQAQCMQVNITSIPEYESSDPVTIEALEPLVAIYLQRKKEAEAAETARKETAELLRECLLEHKTKKVASATWSVSWSPVKGSETVDVEAMRADGMDLTKYMKTGVGRDQIRVTERLAKTRKKKA